LEVRPQKYGSSEGANLAFYFSDVDSRFAQRITSFQRLGRAIIEQYKL
jgi:hypothetical protein